MSIFGALVLPWLQACASPGSHEQTGNAENSAQPSVASERVPDAGSTGLDGLALRERTSPRHIDAGDPIWAILGVEAPVASEPADDRATAPLDGALAALASMPAPWAPPASDVGAEDREAGAFLLTSASAMLVAGDAAGALEQLNRAIEIDPGDAEIQSARVRALVALNRRIDASEAAESALSLGAADPLTLVIAGLVAGDRGEHDASARALARAIESGLAGLDASVRPVALGALGRSMLELGWKRAGAEALTQALTDPPKPSGELLLRSDLVRLLGRREALWASVGEALREIDPDAALDAYALAGKGGSGDAEFGIRQMAVLVRSGRPSEGAAIALRDIARTGRPPSGAESALIRTLGSSPEVRPALVAALRQTSEDLAPRVPSTRASLLIAAAELSSDTQAIKILLPELLGRTYNDRIARALLGSERIGLAERAALAARGVERRPELYRMIAAALLSGPTTPAKIRDAAGSIPDTWSAGLLRSGIDLQLRRARDALAQLGGITDAPAGVFSLARIETGAEVGRWDIVHAALDELGDAPPSASLVRSLRAGHRFEAASEIAERLPTEDQLDLSLLLELAELAIQLERPRDAELYLEMGGELDPYDERVLGARLALYGPNGPLADTAQHTRVLRALRERAPDGVYASLLGAQELANSGILDEAQQRLRTMAERNPDERGAFEMLHQIWARQDDPALTGSAIAWLQQLIAVRPGAPAPSGALARLLAAEDRFDEAMRVLDSCEEHAASPVMARLRERLMRDNDRADEATAHALARLDHPTLSIDDSLELAEVQIREPELGDALITLTRGLPSGVTLTPAQRARLVRIASVAVGVFGASATEEAPIAALGRPVLGILELTIELAGPLPWSLHNARIALTAMGPENDVGTIQRVCEASIAVSPERAADAYRVAAQTLLSAHRVSDAVELTTLGAVREGYLDEELFSDAITVAAQVGEAGDARAMIERLDERGLLEPGARLLRPEPDTPLDTIGSQRAELAYQIASIAAFLGRDELSESAYRLALEFDPTHAWSNNDLGYMIVDRGSDVPGGEALIARAYESLPQSPNVTDSLAWARYKLGRLQDTPEGEPGAITLLRRAIELQDENDRENATLHDHLGDALWRSGQTDEASEAWLDAETIALEQTRLIRREQGARGALDRLESRLRSVRRKLRAVQVGEAPPIAPIVGEAPAQDPGG